MLLVVRGLLFAVCRSICVVRCLLFFVVGAALFVGRCSLVAVCCSLCVFVACCLLFAVCCDNVVRSALSVVGCLLCVVRCVLRDGCCVGLGCWRSAVNCGLLVVRGLLFVA